MAHPQAVPTRIQINDLVNLLLPREVHEDTTGWEAAAMMELLT